MHPGGIGQRPAEKAFLAAVEDLRVEDEGTDGHNRARMRVLTWRPAEFYRQRGGKNPPDGESAQKDGCQGGPGLRRRRRPCQRDG